MIAWYLVTSGFVDPAGLSTATGVMAYVDSTFSVLPGGEATAAVGTGVGVGVGDRGVVGVPVSEASLMPAPIRAFVGPNGGGKTLAAIVLAVEPALASGRPVVATCSIEHPNARRLESWRQIPDLRDCVLFLDEISSALPSRGSMAAPAQLVRTINQLRKVDVQLVWTAPNWARADVMLREVTQEVTACRGFIGDPYEREPGVPPWWRPLGRKLVDDETDRPVRRSPRWPSNCLFRWVTYDAAAFDEFSLHAVKKLRPTERMWYWRPWHEAHNLYNTLEGVSLLDHVDETGVCVACGGMRRRPPCSCESHPGGRPHRPARAEDGRRVSRLQREAE